MGTMPRADTPSVGALSTWEKAGYSLGDAASNFYWKTFEVFILFFYTDVFGLPAMQVGTMLLVSRTWDAVADPLMGAIADRTSTRFGKFRPYLLWGSVPLAITGVLTFSRPALSGGALLAYAYATYTAMMIAYTAVNIPYSALLGVITPSSADRMSASTFRFLAAFGGGLLVQSVTLPLVKVLGGADPAAGWQRAMMLYGVGACALFVLCFLSTRERISPPANQHANFRRDLGDLTSNRPWCILFALGLCVIVSFWLRGGATAYYFKYCCRRPDLVSVYFGAGTVASMAGVALTAPLTRIFGKRNLYAIVMALGGFLTLIMYWVPPENTTLVLVLGTATAFVLGPNAAVIWSMYADAADYSEWRTGRRNTGLVFSAGVLSMKLGGAVGGWALGILLDHFGYVPNAEQTPSAQHGILLAVSVVPALFCFLASGIVAAYELDEGKVATIERELEERRATAREGVSVATVLTAAEEG
jgi:glycoside/pentoside/hexuronide:cation symporter, GPH family